MSDGVTIGLETHVQLDTDTKLFCGCSADLSDEPNTHTCETCLGMPGSKPRTNARVVEYAVKAAMAFGCSINDRVRFSRKTYFYPDMAKNFQITQYEIPIGGKGSVRTRLQGEEKEIGIKRVHIEEDPARLVHKGGDIASSDYTLVDYNRAGIPLIEVVTEPDFDSPGEARAFLQKLTQILEYLDVYDPSSDLSIKSDANISIDGGDRVEVKNITGTKGIENALNYEITRQRNLQKRGRDIERETRSYSSAQEITTSLRQKEMEAEYGYIFEPDLTQLGVDQATRDEIRAGIPELPDQKFDRFQKEYGLEAELVDSLITDPELADAFEELADDHDTDLVASWLTGELKKTLNYNEVSFSEAGLETGWLDDVIRLLEDGRISDRNAEMLLRELVDDPRDPQSIVEEQDLLKADEGEVKGIVQQVVDDNPEAVDDYQNGEDDALNFLVGQVMQQSQGKADPKQAREMLLEAIE
ncbi:MAG: Asp-tRNA(Asn)/Glu-tRNA(Gln) amidotransferase subunit GatB [Candidatus Nanohaloarchaea archaeon]|nr:Asp-tRNA(Asn)/Glu-tRNA(Gln) amidotransferase subunit GatB [Candidatus Nanohaloarchaea archaeon]